MQPEERSIPRSILGDISNRVGVREPEKTRVKGLFSQNSKRFRISPRPCTGINALKGNVIAGISKLNADSFPKCPSSSEIFRSSVDAEPDAVDLHVTETEDGAVLPTADDDSISLRKKVDSEVVNDNCPAFEQCLSQETGGDLSLVCNGSKVDHCTNNVSSDCEKILYDSQESRVVESDDVSKNLDEGTAMADESIKTCSCSFCLKAGLLWLDLQHQDVKARASAVKKSQREASILAELSFRSKITTKETAMTTRVCKMEAHLMHQWRSLFHHTANVWEKEAKDLEANLCPLTDLRKKCINDMDTNHDSSLPTDKKRKL